MREIITSDLQRVSQLTSDFLLCDHTLSPSSFGGEKGMCLFFFFFDNFYVLYATKY